MTKRPLRARMRKEVRSDVGYGRPPKRHQFKPGESGNPKGRRKGAKNEATILQQLLNRKIPIQQAGLTRKITVLEAILLRFTEASLKGDTKSATFLLNRHAAIAPESSSAEAPVSEDDRKVLEAFARRVLEEGSARRRQK